ncbi:hypothetical protein [Lentibacillus populi]|nr:hypothetical protein [Lentibacillus populi]
MALLASFTVVVLAACNDVAESTGGSNKEDSDMTAEEVYSLKL